MDFSAEYHFPHDVLSTLIEAIPAINKGKEDMITFFRGAGVPQRLLGDLESRIRQDRNSVRKVEIARTVLERLNAGGDSLIGPRRAVLRRTVEFEDFSACWENDRLKAEASVRRLRELVNAKDTVRKLERERTLREEETRKRAQEVREELLRAQAQERRQILDDFQAVARDPKAQRRGKSVEAVLNALFKHEKLLLVESFERRSEVSGAVLEQIDGTLRIGQRLALVEMKWLSESVTRGHVAPWLVSLYQRHGADGIFVSATRYTEAAVDDCKRALTEKRVLLLEMHELISAFESGTEIGVWLDRQLDLAQLKMNPRPGVTI